MCRLAALTSIFPHHEMSASHARVAFADAESGVKPDHGIFARNYVHAGMVRYQGAKMSKSLGNLVFVSRLREAGVDPMAIRLAILAHHYRSDWDWTNEVLTIATDKLARWRSAVASVAAMSGAPSGEVVLAQVRERMADDLDAPGALAAVDAWADAVLAGEGGSDSPGVASASLVGDVTDALLGVRL